MKYLLITVTLLASITGFGQTSEETPEFVSKKWEKVRVGLFLSSDFNSTKGISENELYNFGYKAGFNHSVGMQWLIRFSDRVELGFDPGYSSKNFTISEDCKECGFDKTNQYKLKYLQLPIYGRFYVTNSRLDIYGIAGVNMAFNLYSAESRISNGATTDFLQTNANRFLIGSRVGAGVNYNLNFRTSLGFDLTYNHFFNPMMVSPNINSSGISISPSILYRF